MTIEIVHRYTRAVLYAVEKDNLKDAMESAVSQGANLEGANLRSANGLENFPIQIGAHRHWLCTTHGGKLQIGCYVKTFEEWEEEAEQVGKENNYTPLDIEIYKLHIAHIAQVARLLWNADKKETAE